MRPILPCLLLLLATTASGQEPSLHFPGSASTGQRAAVLELAKSVGQLGTGLQVADVIWGLEGRYGAFADLDGDGDLDYVATEMSHRRERATMYLRLKRGIWRRMGQASREFNQKHPLTPWVIPDDGTGKPAILLPTGWPPYLYLYRTNGRGRFRGKPLRLDTWLPRRVSEVGGVDNCPYEITEVVAAKDGKPARIRGEMHDQDRDGKQQRHFSWEITLVGDEATAKHQKIQFVEDEIDWDRFPHTVTPVRREVGCTKPGHQGSERLAIMANKSLDLDGDGIRDLVHFTGDFAAHVFLGRRDPKTRKILFQKESPGAFPVPRKLMFRWLWAYMKPSSKDFGYAANADRVFKKLHFKVLTPETGDARVVMYGNHCAGFAVYYYWNGRTLVPIIHRCHRLPRRQSGDHGWTSKARHTLLDDFDGDGSLDMLISIPAHEFKWLRELEKGQAFVQEGKDFRNLDRYRYWLTWWQGESAEGSTKVLFRAPKAEGPPKDRHLGLPLELERVPVYGETSGERYCVYYRPWKVGIFLERKSPNRTLAQQRRVQSHAWRRRGEQLLHLDQHYFHCDHEIYEGTRPCCTPSGIRSSRRHQEAIFFFEKALSFADQKSDRASLHHLLARCYSRMGEGDKALSAYRRFVAISRKIDPLDSYHPDLAWLFSRAWFKKYHARASKMLGGE